MATLRNSMTECKTHSQDSSKCEGAVHFWARYLNSVCLSFPICEMEIVITAPEDCVKDYVTI